jgi:hypothetical protein
MIYVASMYSTNATTDSLIDQQIREDRYNFTNKKVAEFLLDDNIVFSPIVHSHSLAVEFNLPKEHMWWVELNHAYMDSCDELWVLMMYDNYGSWKDSSGIKDEIAYAKELGLKIKFIECV